MADFMTVLAASQTQAAGKPAKAPAGQIPEGLFGSVLAAQLDLPPDAAATQALPAFSATAPALEEATAALAAPEKSNSAQPADADPAGEAQASLLVPLIVQNTGTPVAAARPALPSGLEKAARPAGSDFAQGQNLPIPLRLSSGTAAATDLPPIVGIEVAARASVGTEGVAPLAATSDRPRDALPAVDMTGVNAAHPLGQFEQAMRVPESRMQVALEAPVRSQAFPAEFSEKVVWLAGRQSQSADISLNPPQLGTIEVRLSLSGGEAGAQFFSPHLAVRDAIEAALPRLREMMAQAGITLGDTQVREEAFSRRESDSPNRAGNDTNTGAVDFTTMPLAVSSSSRARIGLVDLYV